MIRTFLRCSLVALNVLRKSFYDRGYKEIGVQSPTYTQTYCKIRRHAGECPKVDNTLRSFFELYSASFQGLNAPIYL